MKRLASAHSRLGDTLKPAERTSLAEAMFLDTLHKLRRAKTIDDAIIVTADEAVARHAGWLGHSVLRQEADGGHAAGGRGRGPRG